MVSPKFSAEKKKERKGFGVVGFMQGVVAATMRCLFGCFRGKDSHSRLVSSPEHSPSHDENSLSVLFLPGDNSFGRDDLTPFGRDDLTPLTEEFDPDDLANEAKFLKACGTLPETPLEIRKTRKSVDTSAQTEVTEPSSFKSWLPVSSNEKQPEELATHAKTCQEWVAGTDFMVGTPGSYSSDECNTGEHLTKSCQSDDIQNNTLIDISDDESHSSYSSVSSEVIPMSLPGKSKSVRFECESDSTTSSPRSSNQSSKRSGSAGNHISSKASPYPTPLKISDEMQTPGTVFPAYMDNIAAGGKPGRIRSQFVYTHLSRTNIQSHWNEVTDENFDPNNGKQSLDSNPEALLISTPALDMAKKDLLLDPNNGKQSLDSNPEALLTSTSALDMSKNDLLVGKAAKEEAKGASPGERPILGMLEPYWNDDVTLDIPAKSWDGNGIPNTTNKYKEDRKVSWHATPFEERLEKVLSEETHNQKRKHVGGIPLAELNESDDSDSGSSSTASSAHQNPEQLVSLT